MHDEEELRWHSSGRVGKRLLRSSQFCQTVKQSQCLVVQRYHSLSVQLAEWDLQPGPLTWDLVNAVQLQANKFTNPHASCAVSVKTCPPTKRRSLMRQFS